ncbi:ABC transporter permease [Lacinutrix salivirga]
MNISLYIAKRYLRSKSSNNAINFITILAIIGIILGAASLFVVLSGFAGLKDFTLEFTSIVDPDLKAETTVGKSFILTETQEQEIANIEGIASYSKVIEERVIASFDGLKHPAYIKGVDANFPVVNAVDSVIVQGSWLAPKTNQIVVGWEISRQLSFGVLDYNKFVNLYVPNPGTGQISSVKQAFSSVKTVNIGIYDINEELNNKYIYTSIETAQELLGYQPNQISSIEFKLNKNADEASVVSQLSSLLGNDIKIKNRLQLNDALYKMLNSEYLFVYLLLTLVSVILIFNVIGSLIMMILDKKKTLNTLFNIGATVKTIRNIFFLQGSIMTIVGTAIGLFLGYIIVLAQQTFEWVMITPSLPYPMSVHVENLVLVFVTISILGVLASKLAASRISEKLVKTG